jgi:serine-threonine kinase receptor-associated protein
MSTATDPHQGGKHASRQIPIVCPGHTRPLAELEFCEVNDKDETRTFLVSACHDKMPMLRDAATGDWIGTFVGHKGAVWSCKLDPLGLLAGTASGDFSVRVWDAITGATLFTFQHKHIVKTVDFSMDSKRLATGGHEGILRVYDLQQPNKDPMMIPQPTEKKIHITKCLWLDKSSVLAAGSDGAIRFWDVDAPDGGKLLRTFTVGAEVRDMELKNVPGRGTILTVASGDKVYCFDVDKNELTKEHKLPIHFREEGGASLHPSGTKFIAGGSDLWVRVFDFESGREIECHKGHHGPVRCLRYAPDGKTYATGSEDGTIRLWKTDV